MESLGTKSALDQAIRQEETIALTDAASDTLVQQLNPLIGFVDDKFYLAERAKRQDETRALRGFQNFRGIYGSHVQFLDTEKSRAFIKITKTKVMAQFGQIVDTTFANGRVPIEIVASKEPLGFPEKAHIDPNQPISTEGEGVLGFPGDGNDLQPGETIGDRAMNWIKAKWANLPVKMKPGFSSMPGAVNLTPAEEVAKKMDKRIQDQLEDTEAIFEIKKAQFEKVLLGSGILAGPFNIDKEYPDWDEQGQYIPTKEELPAIEWCSFWDFYPDPECRIANKWDWVIRLRKMSRPQLRSLQRNASFRSTEIDRLCNDKPNYTQRWFETTLADQNNQPDTNSQYLVKEFWGIVDRQLVEASGLALDAILPADVNQVMVNIWTSGNYLLRVVLNPFKPARIPFYLCPREVHPYSVFGVGLAEDMEDTQMLMNGFIRLSVDNSVLSGSVMLEVDESMLEAGQDLKVSSGKIFRKSGGPPGAKAINSIQIQNTAPANLQMFDVARRLADEATGIPSFSHGLTGVQGVGRTASGINQLMQAAGLANKTIIGNADDYWWVPIGKAYYYWNMQFRFEAGLRGDLSIVARGLKSFVEKEKMAEQLVKLGQTAASIPYVAAYMRWQTWLKDMALSLELDKDRYVNSPEEAQLQAKVMQLVEQLNAQKQAAAPQGPAAPVPGQGTPARPGQPGFSASSGADVMAERGQDASQGAVA